MKLKIRTETISFNEREIDIELPYYGLNDYGDKAVRITPVHWNYFESDKIHYFKQLIAIDKDDSGFQRPGFQSQSLWATDETDPKFNLWSQIQLFPNKIDEADFKLFVQSVKIKLDI